MRREERIKKTKIPLVCQFQMWVDTEGKRTEIDSSDQSISAFLPTQQQLPTNTYTRIRPPFLSHLLRPLQVMLRANHRPPSILGDDPFSHALKPSPYESDYEKHARLEREIEAKRISDLIDDEIRRDKERYKRTKQDVRVSAL